MIKNNFPLQIILSLIITFFVAIYPLTHYFTCEVIISVLFGCAISLISAFTGYGLTLYSFDKSNRVFFKSVIGGLTLRIIFIGLSIFLLIKIFKINMYGLVVSLFFYYFLFLILEIIFLNKKLLNKNVKQDTSK
jgi:hypothetical protein